MSRAIRAGVASILLFSWVNPSMASQPMASQDDRERNRPYAAVNQIQAERQAQTEHSWIAGQQNLQQAIQIQQKSSASTFQDLVAKYLRNPRRRGAD